MNRPLAMMEIMIGLGVQKAPVNFVVAAQLRGSFSREQLDAALARTRCRNPFVATRLVTGPDRITTLETAGVPPLPVRVVPRTGEEAWVREAQTELARPFDLNTGPMVRFVWLPDHDGSELLMVCNHAIADALSAVIVLRDLLAQLGTPTPDVQPRPVPPPLEDLLPPVSGLKQMLFKTGLRLMLLRRRGQRIKHWEDDPRLASSPYGVIPYACTEAQTAALAERAAREHTTVHGALAAAFLRAYADVRQDGRTVRRVSCPVNCRSWVVPPPEEDFGLYITLSEVAVNCAADRPFWQVAREAKQALSRDQRGKNMLMMMPVMKPILRKMPLEKLAGFYGQNIRYDLSITNLGRLPLPAQYGSLCLERLYGPVVNGTPNEQVLGVSTVNGRMSFTFTYREVMLDTPTAQRLLDRALFHLETACQD